VVINEMDTAAAECSPYRPLNKRYDMSSMIQTVGKVSENILDHP